MNEEDDELLKHIPSVWHGEVRAFIENGAISEGLLELCEIDDLVRCTLELAALEATLQVKEVKIRSAFEQRRFTP